MNKGRLLCLTMVLLTYTCPAAEAAETIEAAMKEVAASLGPALADSGLKKLAVVELTDIAGYRSALGPFLAEELTTQLFAAKPGTFDFVERQQLAKVLEEQKLTSSSLFEGTSLVSVGKVLGIQAIITGSMADLGDQIKINTRVISVESARIVAASSTSFPRQGAAEALLRQSGTPYGGSNGFNKPTQAADVFFRNALVQITVESISVNHQKDRIHLVLALENLTDKPLYLRFTSYATLTSSTTGNLSVRATNGIDPHNSDFTTFDARKKTLISMTSDSGKPVAGFYSLSARLDRWVDNDNRSTFSIGIAGIRLDRVD